MRIHELKFPKGSRWIDLDHVQEVSSCQYIFLPPQEHVPPTGTKFMWLASGYIQWSYRLMFQDKEISVTYSLLEAENVAHLELMRDEYDRFFEAWTSKASTT